MHRLNTTRPPRETLERESRPTEWRRRDSLVIIPTFNEVDNLEPLVLSVLRQGPFFDVLVVDDNSPDGTGHVAEALARRFPGRVAALHRRRKLGLATAYVIGFHYALATGYERIFAMDADHSHDPASLPRLRQALESADVVLGSRYIGGGSTRAWPWWRRLLSHGGAIYAATLLAVPVHDLTTGFKGFRRDVLASLDWGRVKSRGFAFQIEVVYACYRRGYRIAEVPIAFAERRSGHSKMSLRIIAEALLVVLVLRSSSRRDGQAVGPGVGGPKGNV